MHYRSWIVATLFAALLCAGLQGRVLADDDLQSSQLPIAPIASDQAISEGFSPYPAPDARPVFRPPVPTPIGPSFQWSQTENYLILGTDRRPNWSSWRTDTIMVMGLDRERGRAAVLSIPRDLYVDIPNYGWQRINMADYIGENVLPVEGGGPALVSQVLSNTLGISTDHYVRIEMNGFRSFVDAVGGVTVSLDCPFYEPIYNLDTESWDYFTLPAGDVRLDGDDAYWFVRLRYRESDIGRSKRQRQFLWAMRDQMLNANLIFRFPELWSAFRQMFGTDLSLLQMVEVIRAGLVLEPSSVRAAGISLGDLQNYTTPGGAAVLVIADPGRVRRVVDGIWDAPAMVDA